jgi:hypothetical protein
MINRFLVSTFFLSVSLLVGYNSSHAQILFSENFQDGNFTSRGWYDNTNPKLSTTERAPGSTSSLEFRFRPGSILPDSATAIGRQGTMRKKFQATDSLYVRYHVKYSSNWVGSLHEIQTLTNKDGDWTGPAFTRMTFYIETLGGRGRFGFQDSINIDTGNIGKDLTNITENRGVGGCNGDSDGHGKGDCYLAGSNYRNGKWWKSDTVLFGNSHGPYYKNDWHLVEVFVKLNSIVDGKGVRNGIIQYWLDGQPIMDHRNVVLRTGRNPDMKFTQFIFGPYIGASSTVDQTFWVDNLVVATSRIGGDNQPKPPQNLRVTTK